MIFHALVPDGENMIDGISHRIDSATPANPIIESVIKSRRCFMIRILRVRLSKGFSFLFQGLS
jgi:hypothetical protein